MEAYGRLKRCHPPSIDQTLNEQSLFFLVLECDCSFTFDVLMIWMTINRSTHPFLLKPIAISIVFWGLFEGNGIGLEKKWK